MTNQHDVVRTLMTFDDQLDDIKRARIWSQLEDKLEGDVAPRARHRRWPLAVAAVSAAAAIILLSLRGAPDDANTLAVPAATTVTSQIGPHTRAAIVGPAQVDFVGAAGEKTTVRVRSGTLLADFTGGAGRSLRIETRAAVIEVVGTVFAVEARDEVTCTSVVHGRVRVTMPSGVRHVAAGERFCTDDAAVRSIDQNVRDALERHQAVITAHAMPVQPPTAPSTTADASASTTSTPAAVSTAAVPSPRQSTTARATASTAATPARPPTRASTEASTSTATTAPRASTPNASPSTASQSARPSATVPSPGESTTPLASTAAASAPPPSASAPPSTSTAMADVAPPPNKPRATPDELYRSAEKALAARDPKTADRVLSTLVAEYPSSSLVDQALYERARIAYQQRAWTVARDHLDRLAAIANTRLAEPGHYLRCRISVEARDPGAAASCFTDYRARFPRSPHDLEALGVLAQHAYAKGGCAQASAFVGELASTYPRTTLAAAWRARCPVERR
ncbi:MAG: FecR domain-containing protein [Myxococcota bacterium]|nr:FecR domain-containing protein [Deltaproteobacteria bacterium]MDQ3336540.1 FecR domain-containing protein [Myxococcota bacterium]